MLAVVTVTAVYDIDSQAWAIEMGLDGEPYVKRFTIRGPEHMETFLDAWDDCEFALFDPKTGEIRFVFDDIEEDEEEDDEFVEDEDEEEEEDEEAEPAPAPKKKGRKDA